MATSVLRVVVAGDTRGFRTAARDVERDAGRMGKAVDKASGNVRGFSRVSESARTPLGELTVGMRGLGKAVLVTGAALAAGKIARGLNSITQGASDVSESISKNQRLFGPYAAEVEKFAKTSAKQFGLSRRAALEATGTFGNLFAAVGVGPKKAADMSVSLNKLAADLASFNNTSIDDALEAIRSGLVGETEPLRKFGVNLQDATLRTEALRLHLVKNTKEALTPHQKALAVNSLLYKQTSKAQGDFARTSDGLANKQRILNARWDDFKTSVGGKVLPLATDLVGAIDDIADAASHVDLSPITGKLKPVLDGVRDVVDDARREISRIFDPPKGDTRNFAGRVGGAIGDAVSSIDWGAIGNTISDGFSKALDFNAKLPGAIEDGLTAAMDKVDGRAVLGKLVDVIGEAADAAFSPSFWRDHIVGILSTIEIAIPAAKILKIPGAAWAVEHITKPFNKLIVGGLRGAVEHLAVGLADTAPKVGNALARIAWDAPKALAALPGRLRGIGTSAAGALGKGLGAAVELAGRTLGRVITTVTSFGGRIVSGLANGLRGRFSDLDNFFGNIGTRIVRGIVTGIRSMPGAIWNALKGLAGKAGGAFSSVIGKITGRRGGRAHTGGFRRYNTGGVVPAMVSPGEMVAYGNEAMIVPGRPVAADNVPMLLPVGAEVYTGHGQQLLAAGASRAQALAMQGPHFAKGGKVTLGERYTGSARTAGFEAGLEGRRRIGREMLGELLAGGIGEREPDRGGGPSAASATRGLPNVPAGSHIARMAAKANEIDAKHYQYAWGGGHGRLGVPSTGSLHAHGVGPVGLGYDCSGAVSAVLGAGGLLNTPLTSGSLMGWGRGGEGKRLAVYADASHTIMRLGSRFFGTSGQNPGGGAGWLTGNTMAGRGVTRTWPGMRTGGIAGLVQGVLKPGATKKGATADAFAALAARLVDATFGQLAGLIASATSSAARERKSGDRVDARRLDAVANLARAQQGIRLAQPILSVNKVTGSVERNDTHLGQLMRLRGVDSGSAQGIVSTIGQQTDDLARLAGRRGGLTKALDRARATKNKKAIDEITGALTSLDDTILERQAQLVELQRQLPRQQAAERIGGFTRQLSALTLTEQAAGFTASGADDRAAGSRRLDLLRGEESTIARELGAAGARGDQDAVGELTEQLRGVREEMHNLEGSLRYSVSDEKIAGAQRAQIEAQVAKDPNKQLKALDAELEAATAAYQQAEAANDPEAIVKFGQEILGLRGSMEQLANTIDDKAEREQRLADLLQQNADNQNKLIALAQQEPASLMAALVAGISGGIGERVSTGSQTPLFPGLGARW